jgi:hypothetical protein
MAFQCAVTVQAVTAQSMQLQMMAVVTAKGQKLQLIFNYKQLQTVSSCAELPVKQVHREVVTVTYATETQVLLSLLLRMQVHTAHSTWRGLLALDLCVKHITSQAERRLT